MLAPSWPRQLVSSSVAAAHAAAEFSVAAPARMPPGWSPRSPPGHREPLLGSLFRPTEGMEILARGGGGGIDAPVKGFLFWMENRDNIKGRTF